MNLPVTPKVLFIADKWCAGDPAFGLSEWENNLWRSLAATKLADVRTFHFDEYYHLHGKRADHALLQEVRDYDPDILCIVLYKMPGSDVNVPSFETLITLHQKHAHRPIFAIWGDLEIQEQIDISKALLPYVHLNIATASSAAVARINNPKYFYSWVPKDQTVFHNPNKKRDINVSYVGSPKKERLKRIEYLKQHDILVKHGGGERQEHRTTEAYADTFKRSKISLSFARAHASHVINARPFEIMLCGALLMEQENFETPKFYTPYIDYVPYTNNRDLLEKVRYFLEHEDERQAIATHGQRTTETLYSAHRFWHTVLEQLLKSPRDEVSLPSFTLDPTRLSSVPALQMLRWRFLDWISSHATSFFIYKLFHVKYWEAHLFSLFAAGRIVLENRLPPRQFEKLVTFKRKYLNIF